MKFNVTILAVFLFCMPVVSHAYITDTTACEDTEDVVPTHFILCLKDGEKVDFLLEHNPRVVNGDGFITVVDRDITIEYQLDNVDKYMLGVDDAYTGIDKINDDASGKIQSKTGLISLSGFKASEPVVVTNINGVVMFESATDTEGTLSISTSAYPSGIYIVKIKNQTFKFIKR